MASICELLPRSSSSSSSKSAREAEHIILFVGKIFKVTLLGEGKNKTSTRGEFVVGVLRFRDFTLMRADVLRLRFINFQYFWIIFPLISHFNFILLSLNLSILCQNRRFPSLKG